MPRWEIHLPLSHWFSLTELDYWPYLFNSPACKVTKKIIRKKCGYYLTACRFENLDYHEMYESAKRLKIMMRAFAKIETGIDFQSMKFEAEEDFGIREYKNGESAIHARFKSTGTAVFSSTMRCGVLDKNGNPKRQERRERWYDYYLNRCDDWIDSTVIFDALSYFAEKTEARTVRLTYETIKKDEGGKYPLLKNNWVRKTELGRFTCSLNRRDIDGPELHVTNTDLKCNMNLAEAQAFLAQKLLKPWLIKKRELFKLAEGEAISKYLFHKLNKIN